MVGGEKAYQFLVEQYFYTSKGKEMAYKRKRSAVEFYNNLYEEVNASYKYGREHLKDIIQ